jgi:hypothetical protein
MTVGHRVSTSINQYVVEEATIWEPEQVPAHGIEGKERGIMQVHETTSGAESLAQR